MGFKAGLLVGLGIGYWFGAKAGEDRYAQLETMAERLRSSNAYQSARSRASTKMGTVVEDGLAKAKGFVSEAGRDTTTRLDPPIFDQDWGR